MSEKTQDILNLLEHDTPETRQAFEEKYGAFAMNVLTGALVASFDLSSRFKGKRRDLIAMISSYQDPRSIDPLKRAFKRDVKGNSKNAIMRVICQFEDPKATKFLISLIGSDKDEKKAKDCFKQYSYHMKMLKTLRPDLVETVFGAGSASVARKRQCYRCKRTEDKVQMMSCGMCGRSFCVDHNYYNGYCSITCAK